MNPYENLPEKAFWKPSVANKSIFDISDLWDPKFNIQPSQKVVTFGSCFAQHIGHALQVRGFTWLNTEPPPHGLSEKNARLLNYNIFSSRTGNIYTTSLLKQWVLWALGKNNIPWEIWKKDSRYFDPFRPRIEPEGFASEEELRLSQKQAIQSFRKSIEQADYFVFTLGLTESWFNIAGHEYPMCPGTAAGDFNPEKHKFKNQQFQEILQNLQDAFQMMSEINSEIKFILTVSPVPLTATNTNNHVVVATMQSKSILRAVAGQLATDNPLIDYFPSYEIINSPAFKGVFFDSNQRNVSSFGVNYVMDIFFRSLEGKFGTFNQVPLPQPEKKLFADDVCEEEILEAFGKK
ncbi:MAG TPA: GSCFA domain-containing protein [Anaerolineales bacterium]|nr:GSCFA domain-containing protein [Anaerolineales bacterium]